MIVEEITTEQILDFLVDAESGNYGWFSYVAIPNSWDAYGTINEIDENGDTEEVHNFRLDDVVAGIEFEAENQGLSLTEFMEQYDAADADTVVQRVLFGEIRYA